MTLGFSSRAALLGSVLGLAAIGLLAVLVWWFGPLLPPLASAAARLGIVAALLGIWLLATILLALRRRGRERRLAAGIAGGSVAREEAAAVGAKMAAALAALNKAPGGRGSLYQKPWYAIIGPPGAGKTTALLNAGLTFPLASTLGAGAVPGVGGTRLCDWWFTEPAVLIDTAGRFTTQDSNAAIDQAGWNAFLALLRQTRPRLPLNGVIVAIGLDDIAEPSVMRLGHADAVRRRLAEIATQLGGSIPVYVWLTKADLIAGFTEFFDDLDRDGRAQAWGVTFAYPPPAGFDAPKTFATGLRGLVSRLDDGLFTRLQAERRPEARALIAGFPAQLASLEEPLARFLADAFGGSATPAPLLRGVYFCSGTQEGTPIDRLVGTMARAFGVDQRRLPSLRGERGRSYFLTSLLNAVIFAEAMLGRDPPARSRRRTLLRAASFAAMLVAVLACGAVLFAARLHGRQTIAAMAGGLTSYQGATAALPLDPVAEADLPKLAPMLDQAASLATPPAADAVPFGLSQQAKLHAGAAALYRHALDHALLPRLVWRLEAQIRGNMADPDFLYEATRIYLMLGGDGPLDRQLIRVWMTLDWRSTYPGAYNATLRSDLARHLDALLASPLPSVALDGELVARARARFATVPLAARIYSRIKPSAAAERLPPWRPGDVLGPIGLSVMIRASGRPMSEGVPGFFTPAGFRGVLLPGLEPATRAVEAEGWVLGQDAATRLDPPQLRDLEHAVIALYEADYTAAWDAMLADLQVAPLRSLTEAAQDLYILGSPQSPLRALLEQIAAQVTLATPAPDQPDATGPAEPDDARLSGLLAARQPAAVAATAPGQEIDTHYAALRDLVGQDSGAALDRALKTVADLQQLLARMAAAPLGSVAPEGDDPALALRAQAQAAPQPLAHWLLAIADDGAGLRGGNAEHLLAAAYNGAEGPAALCPVAVNGRFPFTPGSTLDTGLDDFARLFSPGGLIDGFVNTQLRPFLDTSGATWLPQAAGATASPVAPADAVQFQRAAHVRDQFFSTGGATPSLRFEITPTGLDAGARSVTLDLGGTEIAYAHDTPHAIQITWPGPTGMQSVRLVFDPPPPGGTGVLDAHGPWALFRLFGQGIFAPGPAPDVSTLTFTLAGRQATFRITASAGGPFPFDPALLQGFRCPVVR